MPRWTPQRFGGATCLEPELSKRHTIYILVDKDGRYVDAFLSYSEAVRESYRGHRIVSVYGREDY